MAQNRTSSAGASVPVPGCPGTSTWHLEPGLGSPFVIQYVQHMYPTCVEHALLKNPFANKLEGKCHQDINKTNNLTTIIPE